MKTIKRVAFATIILVLASMFTSCDAFASSVANEYSSHSDQGLIYTMNNDSSYTVTVYDATGSVEIEPGNSCSARFNREVSIHTVRYSPADKVRASQSGTTFTFRDR